MKNFLPMKFKNDQIFLKACQFIERSKCMFSSLLYTSKGKDYLIYKNQGAPSFPKDWQLYSLMRGYVRTLIGTAQGLRVQKLLYMSNYSQGSSTIQEYCNNILKDRQRNLYILSRKMKRKDLLDYVNLNYFNLLNESQQFNEKIIHKQNKYNTGQIQINLSKLIQQFIKNKYEPILIEVGTKTFNQYLKNIQNNINYLDLIILTKYSGIIKEQCIGQQFPNIQQFYNEIWKSQPIQVQDNLKQAKGFLVFYIYQKKGNES